MAKRAKSSPGRRVARAGANSRQSERVSIGMSQRLFTKAMLLVVCILLAGAAVVFCLLYIYFKVYSDPQRVFWGMINNNLGTSSVTETTHQSSGGVDKLQTSQISFNPAPVILQNVNQQTTSTYPTSQLNSLVIGTRNADYRRITYVSNLQKGDSKDKYKSLYSVWVKNPSDTPFPQTVNAVLLSSPVLFGNLAPADRDRINSKLESAYAISNITKSSSGRGTYTYNVSINLKKYTLALKDYATGLGLASASKISPNVYKTSDRAEFTFTVDVLSRHLKKIANKGQAAGVEYSAYGKQLEVAVPEKSISAQQFNDKINKLQ
jgi:hypothetical protein